MNHNTQDNENKPVNNSDLDSPRDIASYSDRDEETAAELSAVDLHDHRESRVDDGTNVNQSVGWVALALSIISFFWLPVIMGAAGIIVGIVARNRHAETLGNIAIGAGIVSIVLSLFIRPFV
ncbi:DUF4190 domain-containing protein [Virgibacillus soli]|uniref:DUF4190 domain-containing protein n=1 Tax=Paracerasibacillus soli TaxID=480284 RepID=A0ABU5CQG2_9BACI|nr:DUF4190 domain-containing protein [Virgibacillus soli]MDY0408455.1 DUF4190 domain-containing protein [Virgibacillus soli]